MSDQRYGFDLDGTLDSTPELAHLARALARAGHEIYIITGSSFSKKAIKAKLYGLNVVNYQKVVKVSGVTPFEVGQEKGKACKDLDIAVYFDNDSEVLKGVSDTNDKVTRVYILNAEKLQPTVAPIP